MKSKIPGIQVKRWHNGIWKYIFTVYTQSNDTRLCYLIDIRIKDILDSVIVN